MTLTASEVGRWTVVRSDFTLVGSILSLLFAGIMSYLLATNKKAMKQVRPRMLLVLSSLDVLSALFLLIHAIEHRRHFSGKSPIYNLSLIFGNYFTLSSYSW